MSDLPPALRLRLLGVGAMRSPRWAPAGLLVEGARRVMLDGGPGAVPDGPLDAWLVTDERAELIGRIRILARRWNLQARVGAVRVDDLVIEPHAVVHTSHPTFGYLIAAAVAASRGSQSSPSSRIGCRR